MRHSDHFNFMITQELLSHFENCENSVKLLNFHSFQNGKVILGYS